MASPLPHNHAIRVDISEYVSHAEKLLTDSVSKVGKDGSFVNVFKTTLSGHAILEALADNERPSFRHSSSILQRIPVHLLTSQVQSARIDLRRTIELFFLSVYFSDHPVEWDSLVRNPKRSMQHEKETPILANAHREPSYYRAYAKERFAKENSKLGPQAIAELTQAYASLSESAHAPSATNTVDIEPPIQPMKTPELVEFAGLFRGITSSLCIAACAFVPQRFDALPPVHRAWFDWLIGSSRAKQVRGGKFGIPSLVSG